MPCIIKRSKLYFEQLQLYPENHTRKWELYPDNHTDIPSGGPMGYPSSYILSDFESTSETLSLRSLMLSHQLNFVS